MVSVGISFQAAEPIPGVAQPTRVEKWAATASPFSNGRLIGRCMLVLEATLVGVGKTRTISNRSPIRDHAVTQIA